MKNYIELAAFKLSASIYPSQKLIRLPTPEEALDYIREKLKLQQPLPDIILPHINIPLMDSWKFLKAIDTPEQRNHFHTTLYLYTCSVNH